MLVTIRLVQRQDHDVVGQVHHDVDHMVVQYAYVVIAGSDGNEVCTMTWTAQ